MNHGRGEEIEPQRHGDTEGEGEELESYPQIFTDCTDGMNMKMLTRKNIVFGGTLAVVIVLSVLSVTMIRIRNDQQSSKKLKISEEVVMGDYQDCNFFRLMWFACYGRDDYRFKKVYPLFAASVSFLKANISQDYMSPVRDLWIPMTLEPFITWGDDRRTPNLKRVRISWWHQYWIMRKWNGWDAVRVIAQNKRLNKDCPDLKSASRYFYGKEYSDLNYRESAEMVIRYLYSEAYLERDGNLKRLTDELFSDWLDFQYKKMNS